MSNKSNIGANPERKVESSSLPLSENVKKESVLLMKKMKLLKPLTMNLLKSNTSKKKFSEIKERLLKFSYEEDEMMLYILLGKKSMISMTSTLLSCYFLFRDCEMEVFENYICQLIQESDLSDSNVKDSVFELFIQCYEKYETSETEKPPKNEQRGGGEDEDEGEEEEEELKELTTRFCSTIFEMIESFKSKKRKFLLRQLRKMSQRSKGGCGHLSDSIEILTPGEFKDDNIQHPNFFQIESTFVDRLFTPFYEPTLILKHGPTDSEEETKVIFAQKEVLVISCIFFRKLILQQNEEVKELRIVGIESQNALSALLEFCYTNRLERTLLSRLSIEESVNLLIFSSQNTPDLKPLLDLVLSKLCPLCFSSTPETLMIQITKFAGKIFAECGGDENVKKMVRSQLRELRLGVMKDDVKNLEKLILRSEKDYGMNKTFVSKFGEMEVMKKKMEGLEAEVLSCRNNVLSMEKAMKKMGDGYKKEIQELKKQVGHTKELKKHHADHKKMEAAHQKEIRELKKKHGDEISGVRKKCENDIRKLRSEMGPLLEDWKKKKKKLEEEKRRKKKKQEEEKRRKKKKAEDEKKRRKEEEERKRKRLEEESKISKILNFVQFQELKKACEFSDKWKLLYRGSRDGMNKESLHKKCDGISNTLVIVKSDKGCVFGGFNSAVYGTSSWHNPSGLWLFGFQDRKVLKKFEHNMSNPYGYLGLSCHGISYGMARNHSDGHGGYRSLCLYIWGDSRNYVNLNDSYPDKGLGRYFMNEGERNFKVEEIEIYKKP